MLAEVIQSHTATDEHQLDLRVGERVFVLEKDPSGWWGGSRENESEPGWFPGVCVQIIGSDFSVPISPPLQGSPSTLATCRMSLRQQQQMSKLFPKQSNIVEILGTQSCPVQLLGKYGGCARITPHSSNTSMWGYSGRGGSEVDAFGTPEVQLLEILAELSRASRHLHEQIVDAKRAASRWEARAKREQSLRSAEQSRSVERIARLEAMVAEQNRVAVVLREEMLATQRLSDSARADARLHAQERDDAISIRKAIETELNTVKVALANAEQRALRLEALAEKNLLSGRENGSAGSASKETVLSAIGTSRQRRESVSLPDELAETEHIIDDVATKCVEIMSVNGTVAGDAIRSRSETFHVNASRDEVGSSVGTPLASPPERPIRIPTLGSSSSVPSLSPPPRSLPVKRSTPLRPRPSQDGGAPAVAVPLVVGSVAEKVSIFERSVQTNSGAPGLCPARRVANVPTPSRQRAVGLQPD